MLGAGVAGLTTAVRLAEAGVPVTVFERSDRLGSLAASWLAGGMLAPFCEAAVADRSIIEPGLGGIDWWAGVTPVQRNGTLVVAAGRDAPDLRQFAARTLEHRSVGPEELKEIEPDLAGRFRSGLLFSAEAHLDPRRAMNDLVHRIEALGGRVVFGAPHDITDLRGAVVDCRGLQASAPDLRAVRGEMILLRTREIRLSRPVRLLHPRWPIYVVPRPDGLFMVGATMIESDRKGPITLRSAVELMNAAFALHPAFAEADVVETGAACRPAFSDNLPRVAREGRVVRFSGLYRHGFLLSPACSAKAAELALSIPEAS